ncbi:MAG: AI-2E family transporter [Luteolibacter sp.]
MQYPTSFQQRTLWNACTGVAILVLGALLVGLVLLVGKVFGFLQPVLVPLVVAWIVAYVVEPVVVYLEKRGMTRLWAIVSLFGVMFLSATLLVAAVLPGLHRAGKNIRAFLKPAEQVEAMADASGETDAGEAAHVSDESQLTLALARKINELRDKHSSGLIAWALTELDEEGQVTKPAVATPADPESLEFFWRTRSGRALYESKGAIMRTIYDWVTAGSTKIIGFLGLVIGMIMVPIYLFFFLKDSVSIRQRWHDYLPLKASRFKTELVETLSEINVYLISFFRGQVVVAMIDGLLVGVTLLLFGLPYAIIIGVFVALLGVIPYVGNILCLIPTCIIAYLHAQNVQPFGLGPWGYVGCVIGIFILVQQINSLVTAPKIVGDSVGLHPLTVIFSMLFWSLVLGGFVGALLAVPLTAAIKVLFRRYLWERRLREDIAAAAS